MEGGEGEQVYVRGETRGGRGVPHSGQLCIFNNMLHVVLIYMCSYTLLPPGDAVLPMGSTTTQALTDELKGASCCNPFAESSSSSSVA